MTDDERNTEAAARELAHAREREIRHRDYLVVLGFGLHIK